MSLLGITSSIRLILAYGRIKPDKLLIIIKNKPIPIIFFLGQINSLNAQLNDVLFSLMKHCFQLLSQVKIDDIKAEYF